MKKLLYILLLLTPFTSNATTYYVSNTGADGNNGTSTGTPWQTISKVNGFSFTSGDIIQFNGGQTFSGAIVLAQSVTVQSYGTGQATISSGSSSGCSVPNLANVTINNLIFVGSGISANTVDGINFNNSQSGNTKLQNITISNCTVSAYGGNGISVTNSNGTSGYNNVQILNCIAHDCTGGITPGSGSSGILVQSPNTGYGTGSTTPCFTNVLIDHCTSYNNTGKAGDGNWVGSGIFMGEVGVGVIQYCTAYNNGANSTNTGGGPVGIWVADGINYMMQFNESYSNQTGFFGSDGGGFDIDGGCVNTIVQYNYSHDNVGTGYQTYTYNDGLVTGLDSAVVRYNISKNDASNGNLNQASATIGNDGGTITRVYIYNNSFYQTSTTNPNFDFESGGSFGGLTGRFANNILYSNGNQLIRSNSNNPTGFGITGNDYFPTGAFSLEWNGTTYTSFSSWQTATGLEKIAGVNVGKTVDPVFMSPNGGAIGYKLAPTSGVIGQGLNINTIYGLTIGTQDYFGYPLASPYSIGANQYTILKVLGRIVLH